ncbi:4-glucanase (cellulase) [Diplonema papillatum]|nr:4-glucanase (cellulase) [Diplonema papillatum]
MQTVLLFFAVAKVVGPVLVREAGESVTRYAVTTSSLDEVSASGAEIRMQHNTGVQIAAKNASTYAGDIFAQYALQGRTVSFTADISAVGCSCNAAFYFSNMPAIGSDGQPVSGADGDFYCDANDVNGEWCWEMDVMEANRYVTQVTPHTCAEPPGGFVSSCDKGGCGTNSFGVKSNGMCGNDSCVINTMQPFRYSVHFGDTYNVTLSQAERSFSFQSCGSEGYRRNMTAAFSGGMVLVMSYWGSDYSTMQWLDGHTGCTGDCAGSGEFIVRDIEFS